MITTNTGAKKIENSDNWREIFDAHNTSVDAADRIQPEVAPIINGKQCALGASEGDYVLLRNSTISGKTDGAYKAAKAIPANTDLDSTYLGTAITGGISNDINGNLTNLFKLLTATTGVNISSNYTVNDSAAIAVPSGYDLVSMCPRFIANDVVIIPIGINNGRLYYRLENKGGTNYGIKTVYIDALFMKS